MATVRCSGGIAAQPTTTGLTGYWKFFQPVPGTAPYPGRGSHRRDRAQLAPVSVSPRPSPRSPSPPWSRWPWRRDDSVPSSAQLVGVGGLAAYGVGGADRHYRSVPHARQGGTAAPAHPTPSRSADGRIREQGGPHVQPLLRSVCAAQHRSRVLARTRPRAYGGSYVTNWWIFTGNSASEPNVSPGWSGTSSGTVRNRWERDTLTAHRQGDLRLPVRTRTLHLGGLVTAHRWQASWRWRGSITLDPLHAVAWLLLAAASAVPAKPC